MLLMELLIDSFRIFISSVVLLSSFFVAVPNGFGAALDMGGKAAALLLLEVVGLEDENGLGAVFDMGGNAAAQATGGTTNSNASAGGDILRG